MGISNGSFKIMLKKFAPSYFSDATKGKQVTLRAGLLKMMRVTETDRRRSEVM